jgi:hypothetical protein
LGITDVVIYGKVIEQTLSVAVGDAAIYGEEIWDGIVVVGCAGDCELVVTEWLVICSFRIFELGVVIVLDPVVHHVAHLYGYIAKVAFCWVAEPKPPGE